MFSGFGHHFGRSVDKHHLDTTRSVQDIWKDLLSSGALVLNLDDLSDVTAPTPSSGDTLQWNGSAWVNVPSAGLASSWQSPVIATQNAPPGSPSTGDRYLVGTAGSGAWSGHNNQIAQWSGSAWVFTTPTQGFVVYDKGTNSLKTFDGAAWNGLGAGTTTYAGLTDVALSGLANGDIPVYNSGTGKWVNHTIASQGIPSGTGAANKLAIWSGANTQTYDAEATYDSANNILYIGTQVVNGAPGSIILTAASGAGPSTGYQYSGLPLNAKIAYQQYFYDSAASFAGPTNYMLQLGMTDDLGTSSVDNVAISIFKNTDGSGQPGEIWFRTKNKHNVVKIKEDGRWEFQGMSAPGVSTAGTAALYSTTGGLLQISENGGAYSRVLTAGNYSSLIGTSTRTYRGCRVYGPSGTDPFSWVSEAVDTDAIHDPASPSRMTVPSGITKIRLRGYGYWGSGGDKDLRFKKNGSELTVDQGGQHAIVDNTANGWSSLFIESGVLVVSTGDYFEMGVIQVGTGTPSNAWFEMEILEG